MIEEMQEILRLAEIGRALEKLREDMDHDIAYAITFEDSGIYTLLQWYDDEKEREQLIK